MTQRRVSTRMKFAAMSTSLLIAFVIGEVALRLAWENPRAGQSGSHLVELRIHPANIDFRYDRSRIDPDEPTVSFRTDERSYIRPALRFDTPDATVAFLGGSTTETLAVREDLRFPALVSSLVETEGLKVNTLNMGRSGNTSHDSLNVLLNHVLLDQPDIVVVMHAANDMGVLRAAGDYRSRMGREVAAKDALLWAKNHLVGRSYTLGLIRRFLPQITRAPSGLAWRNNRDEVERLPSTEFRRRLAALVRLCRDFDIEPVLMTQPLSGAANDLTPDWADLGGQDRFNAFIREIGREQNVRVIDLATDVANDVPDWDQPGVLFYDGMHVNDRGSRVYAQVISRDLLPLLREVAAR